jgi:acetyl/propionyl-CoA carboxylase alpha subunit
VKYQVSLDGRTVELELDAGRVTLDRASHSASLTSIPGTPLRQLLIDGQPLTLSVEALGRGRWALTAGGVRWELEVLDERTRHIRSLTGAGEHRRAGGALKAPMPGLVVRVPLEEGQTVEAGAPLVVLEAMKMENELKAPARLRVKRVRVRAGEAVEKGQLLVEFEAEA